jgi:secreted PhoX family phosphatase
VIEMTEDGDDYAATSFAWEMLLLCGDPADDAVETYFAGYDKTKVSPISCPDNCTFDNKGNLWIATDGQGKTINYNDALHMVPVEGEERGHVQQFFSGVAGSETCGPLFNADNTALFIALQHPGEGGTLDDPVSTWPDGTIPPRPAVVVIQKEDGNAIV